MKVSLLAAIAAVSFATSASATVLTFDQSGSGNSTPINQDYGDRVTGASDATGSYGTAGGATGNVVVEYLNLGPNSSRLWTGGYSDLTNVLYVEPDGTADPMAVRFTADAGFNVVLNSFSIGNYGSSVTLPNIQITDGSTPLFSLDNVVLGSSSTPSSGFMPGVQGQELTLLIDVSGLGGRSDNVGLDNISFSQMAVSAVPTPATLPLVLAGLGVLGFAGQRKRQVN